MKWVELIRVRSTEAVFRNALPALISQVEEIEKANGDTDTLFLQHALYEGDFAVVLVWCNGAPPQKTREGLMVADRLQDLGPVDHAVWLPAGS